MKILDTDMCVYIIKRAPETVLLKLKDEIGRDGLCISVMTLAELMSAARKSEHPQKNEAALAQFITIMEVLPFDEFAAAEYGKVCANLQKEGVPLSTMDMLTAALARSEGLTLITNRPGKYEHIPDIGVENWLE